MTRQTLLILITLAGVLAACGPPPPSATPPATEAPTATTATVEATTPPEGGDTPPTAEPAATAAPIPEGWEQTNVEALNIGLAHPPGWEVFVVPERAKIDVREAGGDGWVEFGVINEETAPLWSIADASTEPLPMLEGILTPASQDGTFQEPQNLSGDVWVARGRDTIYNEIVLYGVAPFDGERLLMVGHITADIPEEEQPTAAEEYFPLYQQMFTTFSRGQ
jgi:predicted small lipoprotein YifL